MPIRNLLFDLDGTLVDSAEDILTSALVGFEEIGVHEIERERLRGYLGYPLDELYDAICSDENHERRLCFIQAYRRHYADHCTDRTIAYPGVADTLSRLSHCQLAVATTKPTHTAANILSALNLSQFFHLIRGSDGLPNKPDPAILLEAMKVLDAQPCETVMVGDTDRDILAARAAGIRCLAVTYGGWPKEKLAALFPDGLIDRFEQLPEVIAAI